MRRRFRFIFILTIWCFYQVNSNSPIRNDVTSSNSILPSQVFESLPVLQNVITNQEGVVAYISSYLAFKAIKKFSWNRCQPMWISNDAKNQHVFLTNKQYDYLLTGGLCMPSNLLFNHVSSSELIFRKYVTNSIHNNKLWTRFLTTIKYDLATDTTCSDDCNHSELYIVHLFFNVRIHYFLKQHNLQFGKPGQKRN